jgi:hypothetical protein
LAECYRANREKAEFVLVYIREAHPSDGWQIQSNRKEGIEIPLPKSDAERSRVAMLCIQRLGLTVPVVMDEMNDCVMEAYSAWPHRLYIIGKDGRIAYKGGPGPADFRVKEMAARLAQLLAADPAAKWRGRGQRCLFTSIGKS